MTQAAKAQEPSMEEILASIRRIIADDDAAKTPAKAAEPPKPAPPKPAPPARPAAPPAASATNSQDDIDAMFSGLDDAPETAPAAPAPAQPDILDLTEAMEASNAGAAGFRAVDAEADVDFNEQTQPPPVANTVAEARRQFQQSIPPLLSPSTSAAVDSAFNTLAQTVLVKNARTLEEMVAEMLRPMLKTWLDDNLPGMVERIVRDEIERVSRGRAGPK
jgi:uncharacterized protein